VGALNWRDVEKGTAQYNENILIAEQILLGAGFLILASTLVILIEYHSSRGDGSNVRVPRRRIIIHFLDIPLIVAL
jgi:hypothetical protein